MEKKIGNDLTMLRHPRTLLQRGSSVLELPVCHMIAYIEQRNCANSAPGLPKAAMLSHYNLIAQHCQVSEWKPKPYEVRTMPFEHRRVSLTHGLA